MYFDFSIFLHFSRNRTEDEGCGIGEKEKKENAIKINRIWGRFGIILMALNFEWKTNWGYTTPPTSNYLNQNALSIQKGSRLYFNIPWNDQNNSFDYNPFVAVDDEIIGSLDEINKSSDGYKIQGDGYEIEVKKYYKIESWGKSYITPYKTFSGYITITGATSRVDFYMGTGQGYILPTGDYYFPTDSSLLNLNYTASYIYVDNSTATTIEGIKSAGTIIPDYQTVIISADEYSSGHVISGLPLTEYDESTGTTYTYSYTVAENPSSRYTASYSYDGNRIRITNTVSDSADYVLPNTGGEGTETLYKTGILLILAAAAITFWKKRNKAFDSFR